MSEIVKVSQLTGERGRPRGVEVLGANKQEVGDPQILGAKKAGEPEILDRTTKKAEEK